MRPCEALLGYVWGHVTQDDAIRGEVSNSDSDTRYDTALEKISANTERIVSASCDARWHDAVVSTAPLRDCPAGEVDDVFDNPSPPQRVLGEIERGRWNWQRRRVGDRRKK